MSLVCRIIHILFYYIRYTFFQCEWDDNYNVRGGQLLVKTCFVGYIICPHEDHELVVECLLTFFFKETDKLNISYGEGGFEAASNVVVYGHALLIRHFKNQLVYATTIMN